MCHIQVLRYYYARKNNFAITYVTRARRFETCVRIVFLSPWNAHLAFREIVSMIHGNVCKFLHSWSNIQSAFFAVSKWDESQCAKKYCCLRIATIIASHFPRRRYLNTKPNKPFAIFLSFSWIYFSRKLTKRLRANDVYT